MRSLCCLLLSLLLLAPTVAAGEEDVKIEGCKAYCIAPAQGDTLLTAKEADKKLSVAGLSKLPAILTLCRAFDKGIIEKDDPMQVSAHAASLSGPTAFLESGETAAAGELLKAAVLISAGDAICALGENAFGSETVFLQNIAVTLKELNVEVALTDCVGTGALFSASDILKLGIAAGQSPLYLAWSGVYMDELIHEDGRRTELVNANRLIRSYTGCLGLLTGSSRDDGYCGVFAVKRGEVCYVAAVLGADNSEKRFSAAGTLFDYAFANFDLKLLAEKDVPCFTDYPVEYGDVETVDLVAHETAATLLGKQSGELIEKVDLPETLRAPLLATEPVGTVTYSLNDGETLYTVKLYPKTDVTSRTFMDLLFRILLAYLTI